MPDFPQLKTGAVTQYPARRQFSFATRILRFVDGTEQRFRLWPAVLRSWVIRVDLLTEEELGSLRDFYRNRAGEAQSFRFVDPWDGAEYDQCTLDGAGFEATLRGEGQGDLTLVVRESR
jgi:hypothetical protein